MIERIPETVPYPDQTLEVKQNNRMCEPYHMFNN